MGVKVKCMNCGNEYYRHGIRGGTGGCKTRIGRGTKKVSYCVNCTKLFDDNIIEDIIYDFKNDKI